MSSNEFVIKIKDLPPVKKLPKDVSVCPSCGGRGTANDGSITMTNEEIRVRKSSKCLTCDGHCFVRITPYDPNSGD